jgi:malate permease and related proteins
MSLVRLLAVFFPIFFIAFLGFVFSRYRKADPQLLSELIMYLTGPALFFSSFYDNKLILNEFPGIGICVSVVMLSAFIAVFILRKTARVPLGIYPAAIFMNSSFVGFPVVLMAYGTAGLQRAMVYDFINGIYIFTLGIYIMSQKKDRFELLKLPFIYASLAGLALNYYHIRIPAAFLSPIEMVGAATIPLALLMLGIRMGEVKIKSLALPLLASFLRMGLGAAAAFAVVSFLQLDPLLSKTLIIMSALPSAFMGLVLAEKYKQDEELIASSIALSTFLSALFLPLLLWILK